MLCTRYNCLKLQTEVQCFEQRLSHLTLLFVSLASYTGNNYRRIIHQGPQIKQSREHNYITTRIFQLSGVQPHLARIMQKGS
jgi:hypothetical protein